MPRIIRINEHYFDKKQRTEEEERAMYYMLGSFYGSYLPIESKIPSKKKHPTISKGIIFRSEHKKLVEIVHDELESEHEITSIPERNSSCFKASSVPILYDRLGELGLNQPKKERAFPDYIHKEYMGDFLRGFFDSQSYIERIGNITNVYYGFNNKFLTAQHKIFREAGVQGRSLHDMLATYGQDDSCVIYNILYKGWEFIEKSGLYLKEKHDLFNPNFRTGYWESPRGPTALRVKKALKLIKQGKLMIDIYKQIGYQNPKSLSVAIKRITGKSPREHRRLKQ